MSFFIPKDVVEKLKEAEKINNATKDLEKINDIARQISKDYFDQINMFKAKENTEKLLHTQSCQSFKNYEQELKAINKIQESVKHMINFHENIQNLQKYNEILNKASQELETKKEIYKSIENIQRKYDLFESLKKLVKR